MKNIWEDLEIGDVVLFKEGKKGKPVAFTFDGKVILSKNPINVGYAKITSLIDKGNYFLCNTENVVADYYDGIGYEEFLKVLVLNGYKIGFDIPFETKFEYGTEREIFAYNLHNKTVIVAETFEGSKSFNSINVYCPGMNVRTSMRSPLFSHGSGNMSVLELCAARSGQAFLLNRINEIMEDLSKEQPIKWPEKESVSLWNYADSQYDEKGHWNLWDSTIPRIYMVDSEVEKVFEGSKIMKEVFKKRPN